MKSLASTAAICLALFYVLIIATSVQAQTIIGPPAPTATPTVDLNALQAPLIPGADLIGVIARLIRNVFLLWAGIIAFLFALYGGFIYLTAGGDPARAQQGQRTLMNAVIGMLIIFISYALVTYVINTLNAARSGETNFLVDPNAGGSVNPTNIENEIRGTESNPEGTNRGTESNLENTNRGTTTNPESQNQGTGTNVENQIRPTSGTQSSPTSSPTCEPGVLFC